MYIEDKLEQLLLGQKYLQEKLELLLPDLSSEKGVIHFLQITKNTFNNYIGNGTFIEGEHFIMEGSTKVFIPDAIISLKNSGVKGKRRVTRKLDTLDAVNKKLGIM